MISMAEAAKEKGCSKAAVHKAVQRGELDVLRFSPRSMVIVVNERYKEWSPDPRRQKAARKAEKASYGPSAGVSWGKQPGP